ncbi:uncharacterized protein LOC133892849 isoform X2 [Phragmites australis]|uniref:uncharacterized protein LOC133892849 isoform X2 n=1 Tax=Phragmites australis TaxID=29695 RepID=UPI002D7A0F20|nr:uncharacterized protein LOC133892849 isoform X2 [Phragmites australis]
MARGNEGCNALVQAAKDIMMTPVEQLVLNLCSPELRGNALVELSKKRETLKDLAPLLWHSFGCMFVLVQEIISVYPALSPPTLSASASSRACNALALLQSVASHPETRAPFLKALIPLYLYPILDTVSKARPFEYLRLTSLSVIGALVKVDDTEVINFLVQSGVTPLCLRIMEMGNELSKTASTFIVQKILLDDIGLQYACATADRFFSVSSVLATMVISLADQPSTRVLKHVLRCYLRLTDDPRARIALQISLPEVLKDGTFYNCLREDPAAMQCLQRLLNNLFGGSVGGAPHPGPGHAPGGSPGGASQAGPSCAPGI